MILHGKEHGEGYCMEGNCGHGMILHGKEHGEGYCMEGNGEWCDCKEEGLSYDEEMEALKRA
jgi:hypothetical protein